MSPPPFPRCTRVPTAAPSATRPCGQGCPIALGGLGTACRALHLHSRTSPLLARSGPAFARHWRVDRPSRPMTGGVRGSSEDGCLAQLRESTVASAALARGHPPQRLPRPGAGTTGTSERELSPAKGG